MSRDAPCGGQERKDTIAQFYQHLHLQLRFQGYVKTSKNSPWSNTSPIVFPISLQRNAILLQSPTTAIPANIVTNVIRAAGRGGHQRSGHQRIPALALHLTHNVMTEIALVERRRRVGCTAHAIHFGTLRAGRRAFSGETLAAADGFPRRFGGAGRPVTIGLDGIALA